MRINARTAYSQRGKRTADKPLFYVWTVNWTVRKDGQTVKLGRSKRDFYRVASCRPKQTLFYEFWGKLYNFWNELFLTFCTNVLICSILTKIDQNAPFALIMGGVFATFRFDIT